MSYHIYAFIQWETNADLDLYIKNIDTGRVVFSGNMMDSGLALNQNAHPACAATPDSPEQIDGYFTAPNNFAVWYNQVSDCLAEETPSGQAIVVINTGTIDIIVNGTTVVPGDYWQITSGMVYAGFNNGDQSGFLGGNLIVVN